MGLHTATVLAFGDLHAPLTYRPFFSWLIEQIKDVRPDYIVNVGDWFEALAAKRWPEYPDEKWTAEDEIQAVAEQARAINEAAPNAKKIWLYGNHDDNLFGRQPERIPIGLRECVNWRTHKGTEALDEWVEKTTYKHDYRWRLGPLVFQHGAETGKNGKTCLENMCLQYGFDNCLHISGHTHMPVPPTPVIVRSVEIPRFYCNVGTGADWNKMHYMDRKSKHLWGRACVVVKTSKSACKNGQTAFAAPNWTAELRVHSLFRNGDK